MIGAAIIVQITSRAVRSVGLWDGIRWFNLTSQVVMAVNQLVEDLDVAAGFYYHGNDYAGLLLGPYLHKPHHFQGGNQRKHRDTILQGNHFLGRHTGVRGVSPASSPSRMMAMR